MNLGYKLLAGLLIVLTCSGLGFWAGSHYVHLQWNSAKAQQAKSVAEHKAAAEKITLDVALRFSAQAEGIRDTTRVLVTQVPIYVTHETDRRYPLPVGFIRLYSAAVDQMRLPNATSAADERPSGVPLSAVAGNVVTNYGACHAIRAQLVSLQDWVRKQSVSDGH